MSHVKHLLDTPAIDAVWIDAARSLGFTVVRTDAAYATSDGQGVIAVGARSTLDADDCLAQLVFHELCHALVQGGDALELPDWGLDNASEEHVVNEYACLRVQASLADAVGLRVAMAPTTVVKSYYNALGDEAMAGSCVAVCMARVALSSSVAAGWLPILRAALRETARLSCVADTPVPASRGR